MPFDFNNPFGQQADPFGDPFAQRRPPALIQPLAPAQQESMLSSMGGMALGGLGWLGETLDKSLGGRTVRGLLGGRGLGESLAHLIPFSDTLGVTNPEEAVSGKELLGFDKHDDSWTGFGTGLGAEILLDPATYMTFGGSALSKLGKAAQKASVLPEKLAARARGFAAGAPEADTLARNFFQLPHGPVTAAQLAEVANKPLGGAAAFAGNVLGGERLANWADVAKDYALYSRPVRSVAPLFDARLSQFGPAPYSEAGQRAVRGASADLARAKSGTLMSHFDTVEQLRNAGMDQEAALLRQWVEGHPTAPLSANQQVIGQVGGQLANRNAQRLEELQDAGLPVKRWEGEHGTAHFPREATADVLGGNIPQPTRERGFGQLRTQQGLHRIPEFDIPGGTEAVNNLLRDPQAVARGTPQQVNAAREYARNAIGYNAAEHQTLQAMNGGVGPLPTIPGFQPGQTMPNPDFLRFQELQKLQASGNYLADMAAKLPDTFRTEQRSFFGNHPVGDATVAELGHQRALQGTNVLYDMAARGASAVRQEGSMSIPEFFQKSGLVTTRNAAGNARGAEAQIMRRLEQSGVIPAGAQPDVLKHVFIAPEIAQDLARYGQSFAVPETLKPVLRAWDYMTNLTKTGQTVPWPAFHARNFLSGLWQNVVGGAHYPGGDFISGLRDAGTLRGGGVLPWANTVAGLEHLSSADASRHLLEMAYSFGAREPAGRAVVQELLGKLPHELGAGELGSFAGRQEKGLLQSVREMLPGWAPGSLPDPTNAGTGWRNRWNPLNYETFAPAKAGREVSHVTDDMNRMAGFLGYLRQGFDPEVAATRIKALHYSGATPLAPFEREFMRRLVPFYGFARHNLPFQLEQLLTRPGGTTANALSAVGQLRQQQGLLPDWIGEGAAIPVGERQNGNQRYLTSLGLPFEDLNKVVSTGPNSTRRTWQQLLGELNPMIKGPLEYATNTQFYSGRNLDDLYARSGNPTLDQILMNTPLSRAFSMGSMLMDPRKGVSGFATNFASPFRLTDVDMQRAQDIQARRLVEEQLRSNPNVRQFTNFFLSPEQAQTVDPQTLGILRMYRTLVDQAKARSQANHPAPALQFQP